MNITRTSFAFPTPFYRRLARISKDRRLSLAKTVQMLLEPVLENEEEKNNQHIYAAFKSINGIVKTPVTDASQTIDKVLYEETSTGEKS